MSYSNKKNALNAYGQTSVSTEASVASPHRLVQMLMEGVLTKIATAKGHINRKNFAGKSEQITMAMSIIAALKGSLDMNAGGAIAVNLDDLYGYMTGRLIDANTNNDVAALDEVTSLMGEIKSAWDAMPEDIKSGGQPSANLGG
ncbi:MAG: flagellar export chaperone FliS [Chromatiales bacterium]|jgi:flagellar protein FliS